MDQAKKRRVQVFKKIKEAKAPLSASTLAKELGVSRQVIVGDVALLRAEGQLILATARGYLAEASFKSTHKYVRKIACRHTPSQTKDELYLLIDQGVYVEDVIIEHEVYGELTGTLGLESRADVDLFVSRLEKAGAKLLSELTQGIRLHTISCESKEHFETAMEAMRSAGFLLSEDA